MLLLCTLNGYNNGAWDVRFHLINMLMNLIIKLNVNSS